MARTVSFSHYFTTLEKQVFSPIYLEIQLTYTSQFFLRVICQYFSHVYKTRWWQSCQWLLPDQIWDTEESQGDHPSFLPQANGMVSTSLTETGKTIWGIGSKEITRGSLLETASMRRLMVIQAKASGRYSGFSKGIPVKDTFLGTENLQPEFKAMAMDEKTPHSAEREKRETSKGWNPSQDWRKTSCCVFILWSSDKVGVNTSTRYEKVGHRWGHRQEGRLKICTAKVRLAGPLSSLAQPECLPSCWQRRGVHSRGWSREWVSSCKAQPRMGVLSWKSEIKSEPRGWTLKPLSSPPCPSLPPTPHPSSPQSAQRMLSARFIHSGEILRGTSLRSNGEV